MISEIRIQNLRSLVDTGFIEIKPLTILLGSNSSGKSTFLRSFPLLHQSVTKNLREPISWFDDSLVDFGDFDTAKSRLAPPEEGITFSYKFKDIFLKTSKSILVDDRLVDLNGYAISNFLDNIRVSITYQKDNQGTYVSAVTFSKEETTIRFEIKDRDACVEFYVDGGRCLKDFEWKWYYSSHRSIMPNFIIKEISEKHVWSLEGALKKHITKTLSKHCYRSLTHTERLDTIEKSWVINKENFLQILKTKSGIESFKKKAKCWDITCNSFKDIYNSLAIFYAMLCFDIIDDEQIKFYRQCSYVAPMRAAANRYYRTQGLQVKTVDPYGKNLVEFISSLNDKAQKSYREFTKSVLGLEVKVGKSVGHQQIVLCKNNEEVNMTDVGFGYSQIIPIITSLWHSSFSLENVFDNIGYYSWLDGINKIMLVEQPELHLHPAMQAQTADIIMLVLNEIEKANLHFQEDYTKKSYFKHLPFRTPSLTSSLIIETHSQAIINRIGRRIREKRFDANKVSILLFEKDEKTGKSTIKNIGFNENGQLTNWPYGFFEPKQDDYDILFDKQLEDKG